MKKVIIVVGLLAVGAVGWATFGDQITNKATSVTSEVQRDVHDKAQELTNSLK